MKVIQFDQPGDHWPFIFVFRIGDQGQESSQLWILRGLHRHGQPRDLHAQGGRLNDRPGSRWAAGKNDLKLVIFDD